MTITFQAWPKAPRLFRQVTITEKIDGTNAAVHIRKWAGNPDEFGIDHQGKMALVDGQWYELAAQSRNRLLTPQADNFGFAAYVYDHAVTLAQELGEGLHFGEWWGRGIQRAYGLDERRFSLFNVAKHEAVSRPEIGLDTVPVLYEGPFDTEVVHFFTQELEDFGSRAKPGFDRPEGVIVYHSAANACFKVLLENDHRPKGLS